MRQAIRNIPEDIGDAHRRGEGFVVGAIFCAAVMVALFALHGAPNILGERFDATPPALTITGK